MFCLVKGTYETEEEVEPLELRLGASIASPVKPDGYWSAEYQWSTGRERRFDLPQ